MAKHYAHNQQHMAAGMLSKAQWEHIATQLLRIQRAWPEGPVQVPVGDGQFLTWYYRDIVLLYNAAMEHTIIAPEHRWHITMVRMNQLWETLNAKQP